MKQPKAMFRPVVFILGLVLTLTQSMFAHAHPKSTMPAPDSTGPAPTRISITFSEAVEPKFSSIKLTNMEGKSVDPEVSKRVPGDPTTYARIRIFGVRWSRTVAEQLDVR